MTFSSFRKLETRLLHELSVAAGEYKKLNSIGQDTENSDVGPDVLLVELFAERFQSPSFSLLELNDRKNSTAKTQKSKIKTPPGSASLSQQVPTKSLVSQFGKEAFFLENFFDLCFC